MASNGGTHSPVRRGPRLDALGTLHPILVRDLARQVILQGRGRSGPLCGPPGMTVALRTSREAAGSLARYRICGATLIVQGPRRMELRAPRPGWGSQPNLPNLATLININNRDPKAIPLSVATRSTRGAPR